MGFTLLCFYVQLVCKENRQNLFDMLNTDSRGRAQITILLYTMANLKNPVDIINEALEH